MEETCHTAGVLDRVLDPEDPDMGITDLDQGRGADSGSGTKTVRINGRGVLKGLNGPGVRAKRKLRNQGVPELSGRGLFFYLLLLLATMIPPAVVPEQDRP